MRWHGENKIEDMTALKELGSILPEEFTPGSLHSLRNWLIQRAL
jgi:hypothetical protein